MRRFECVEGSASKFWEVDVAGDALTVRYGRIGSNGQIQTKSFASAAKAQAEHDKLIREKTGKGYAEVGSSASAPTQAARQSPLSVGRAPASVGPDLSGRFPGTQSVQTSLDPHVPLAPSGPQATPSPTPASEPQPPGEFRGTPAWRKALPVWRGESFAAPPPLDRASTIAEFAHAAAPTLVWREGERAQWQGPQSPESMRALVRMPELPGKSGDALVAAALGVFGVPESLHGVALAGGELDRAQLGRRRMPASGVLMLLPPLAARSVLQAWGPLDWYDFGSSRLESVIAWLDGLAVPLLENFAERSLEFGLRLAQPLASARVAQVAANALRTSKKFKPLAQNWLLRHAQVAADALLPLLAERKGAQDAGFALRWLLAHGRETAVEAAAESYGADGRATLAALRAFDPLSLAPAKAPRLPSFWRPTGHARPLLHDGRALPAAVLDAIGEMLAFTPLDSRYAGLDLLRDRCRPASLGAFAWDLFQSWLDAGAPAKEQWAFAALAHIGDDERAAAGEAAARLADRRRQFARGHRPRRARGDRLGCGADAAQRHRAEGQEQALADQSAGQA